MTLKPDCVRDILLYLEENLTIDMTKKDFNIIDISTIYKHFEDIHSNYSKEDIWYTVYNLWQVKFISGDIKPANSHSPMYFCRIENITWNGHQFLANIRPKPVWDVVTSNAKKLGGMSLQGLNLIASAIIQQMASSPELIQALIAKL